MLELLTDGGITIDLASLNQVTVYSDQSIAGIGPGNRWANVYTTLDPLDLVMVGGRVSDVSVEGLMTGGTVTFTNLLFHILSFILKA